MATQIFVVREFWDGIYVVDKWKGLGFLDEKIGDEHMSEIFICFNFLLEKLIFKAQS